MTIAPCAQLPQFLHLGMRKAHLVLYGEALRIENTDVTTQSEENTTCFISDES
jgi:hypothetical protein